MTSPRKFAEKIALIQQKQAEGDAAFHTIIDEVEDAKKRGGRIRYTKTKFDISTRKYDAANGMNNSDSNNFANQSIKIENNKGSDRLLLPPDNSSWRRTNSDSSLHQALMPTVIAHYHTQHNNENNNQQINYNMNDIKFESPSYSIHPQHLQVSNSQFPLHHHNYDLNNNNYANDRTNVFYPQTSSMPQQPTVSSQLTNTTHTHLGARYSGGHTTSNVLMLPPNHHLRGGGSLPDLRVENVYNDQQLSSFSTVSSPQTSTVQQFFRSPSPQQHNHNGDLFTLGPQQHLSSNVGPLKTSPSMRRRHSPIGEVKQSSPRRQNSPSPSPSSTQQSVYRVEPQSPQSQSSYSPQNSPHLLPSPGNDHAPFSPQQQQQQSTDNQQPYFTLPNHFDQISLDNHYYQQQQPSSPSSQNNQNHSLPTTPAVTNNLHQRNFYPSFIDDISLSYCHNQPTNISQKSPTIPNIILTDVDSSKLDLFKELTNDFQNPFDSLIDSPDLQLNTDDFLLNAADLSVDPIICDDTYRMER